MEKSKKHKCFVEGPITSAFIADSIEKHSAKHNIGAHAIFLGQVRADNINGKKVVAIDYTAYDEMAEIEFHKIREACFAKYPELCCMHIYHSRGLVKTGENSLFVFVSSPHRKDIFNILGELVDSIKASVPVWGREVLEDGSHVWKENIYYKN
ncbi:MAG: molybdenum cofactor biosynthesis protein MoaE [Cytophagaceae bacterium]